ncbi:MAG: SirB1 family protein [Burkholderiales bacterium]
MLRPTTLEVGPSTRQGDRLQDLMAGPAQHIDLAEAALLAASHLYPQIDVGHYRRKIAEMAAGLRARIDLQSDIASRIRELNRYFFGELGFSPNATDYYDPRNSCLNDVLERRTGIPITLSLLYMECGRGADVSLQGVSFPGHFLVKCALPGGFVVLDPYARGVTLDLQDLRNRLRAAYGGGDVDAQALESALAAADNKAIMIRLLRNLKAIYLQSGRLNSALPIMHWILAAAPREPLELRDRGMIYQELECFRPAMSDFENYLRSAPQAADAQDIRARIAKLRLQVSSLN